jgi:hypothetical protein
MNSVGGKCVFSSPGGQVHLDEDDILFEANGHYLLYNDRTLYTFVNSVGITAGINETQSEVIQWALEYKDWADEGWPWHPHVTFILNHFPPEVVAIESLKMFGKDGDEIY